METQSKQKLKFDIIWYFVTLMCSANMDELWNISAACGEKTFGEFNISFQNRRVDDLDVALKEMLEVKEEDRETCRR